MINECQRLYCSGDITEVENSKEAMSDPFKTWEIHHRLELTKDGDFAHSPKELKELGLYYGRPAKELIFLTTSEHEKLHLKSKKASDIEDDPVEMIEKELESYKYFTIELMDGTLTTLKDLITKDYESDTFMAKMGVIIECLQHQLKLMEDIFYTDSGCPY